MDNSNLTKAMEKFTADPDALNKYPIGGWGRKNQRLVKGSQRFLERRFQKTN